MARRVLAVAVLLANALGCSGSGSGEAVGKTCSDSCGAIFGCAAQLGNVDPDYSRSYCTMSAGGTWVSTCPIADRAASCLVFTDAYGGGSRQVYYASYTGDLLAREADCNGNAWGGVWNTY